MGNIQNIEFNKEEVQSIYNDIFDKNNNVYVVSNNSNMRFLPTTYTIYCKNPPVGIYEIEGKRIKLHDTSRIIWDWNQDRSYMPHYTGKQDCFGFQIVKDCKQVMISAKFYTAKQIEDIVFNLRKQCAVNSKMSDNTLSR